MEEEGNSSAQLAGVVAGGSKERARPHIRVGLSREPPRPSCIKPGDADWRATRKRLSSSFRRGQEQLGASTDHDHHRQYRYHTTARGGRDDGETGLGAVPPSWWTALTGKSKLLGALRYKAHQPCSPQLAANRILGARQSCTFLPGIG